MSVKISELTELKTVSENDEIPIVDVANKGTKKIKVKTLLANIENLINDIEGKINGITLYENLTGTKEDVPLNENSQNFKKIKIIGYGVQTVTTYFEVELENPNQKNLGVSFNVYNGGSFSYLFTEIIKFNEQIIERGTQWQVGFGSSFSRQAGEIFITKVIGYK